MEFLLYIRSFYKIFYVDTKQPQDLVPLQLLCRDEDEVVKCGRGAGDLRYKAGSVDQYSVCIWKTSTKQGEKLTKQNLDAQHITAFDD